METIVVWTYIVGFSLPLLGSAAVLIRSIGSLMVSGGGAGGGPSLMKVKPLPTTLVVLVFLFLVLLAVLVVVFFIFKFAVSRYSLPISLNIAGFIMFFIYISGSGILFFFITGRSGWGDVRHGTLSGALVEMVTEKVMGGTTPDR